ncbi:hypothetical protein AHiyo6_25390, partial [Arthrobacter sp. Hiyo6]
MPCSRFSQFHLNQRMAAAPASTVHSNRIRAAPSIEASVQESVPQGLSQAAGGQVVDDCLRECG